MDKRTASRNLMIALSLIIVLSACSPHGTAPLVAPQATQIVLRIQDLPPELEIPSILPTTIQDPKLLEAWVRLYNRPGPLFQWDGSLLTGKRMAQLILDQSIPVLWDAEEVCAPGGGACSIRYCGEHTCTYDGDYPGADPIYIAPVLQDDPLAVLGTLAHEIYHRLEPFGGVRDTLFEEYCAYAIEAQVSGASQPTFGIYDPLDPDQLRQWFKQHKMDDNYQLESYPALVALRVKHPDQANASLESLPNP